jgi:aspartate/methionine/tyrosine aminotransferase
MQQFRPFEMERWQSLHENRVPYNLSESGVHPLTLRELLELAGGDDVLDTGIGYGQSNGSDELRARIAALYGTATLTARDPSGSTATAAARDPSSGTATLTARDPSGSTATAAARDPSSGSATGTARDPSSGSATGKARDPASGSATGKARDPSSRSGTGKARDPSSGSATVADPDHIVVTNGSAEANFLVLQELVRAGDDVVMIVPAYMQAYGLAQNAGARVVEVPLREEDGWQPDPDAIRAAVTERTRVVVVTNPGNPTGSVLHEEARAAVVEAAARTGAWILADEVYAGAELEGPETPSLLGSHERVVATGSLSKAYGLAGLRIGWAATADAELAERIWARSDYTTISTGELTDRLACVALGPGVRQRLLERTRGIIGEGVAALEAWRQRDGRFHWRPPDAGAIGLLRYDAPVASHELAERLRAEAGVLVVPGTQFGLGRYIRIGVGIQPRLLVAGLDGVSWMMDRLDGAAG